MFYLKRYFSLWLFLVINLVATSVIALPIYAPSQLDIIKKRGYIKVGIFSHDAEPFIIYKQNHELVGIDVELAKQIGEILGVKVVFDTRAKEYGDLIQQAYLHQDDIVMSGIVSTPIRAKSIYFSQPYYKFQIGMLVSRMRFDKLPTDILTAFNQSKFTIGELYGSAFTSYVQYLYPQAKIKLFHTNDELFAAVKNGQIDATMTDELVAKSWLANEPERAIVTRYYPMPGYYASYAIGTSYDYSILGKWLNSFAQTAIDIGFTNRLLEKYTRGTVNERW